MTTVAIVPAAGQGRRLGADKALLDLGGAPAFARIAAALQGAFVDHALVVRRRGASPLPPLPPGFAVVEVDGDGDMADSLRAALAALPPGTERVVVQPVDHALVAADTVLAVTAAVQRPGISIALPLFRDRPGHPVALRAEAFAELRAGGTLRDVVRRDATRVRAVPTASPWVVGDLDRPEDLRAARAAIAALPLAPVELMWRHRSHRAYTDAPLAPGQLERLVDAARHASTSSFIQAYAVVAVTDAATKAAAARLCADQAHIHQAPVFAAICADIHKLAAACAAGGDAIQAHSLELFLQATVDAALVGQNLALAAESEGLGICMIGAARNHPVELARLLSLPPGSFVAFGMTIGHPADDPVPRERMGLAGVLHRDRYDGDGTAAALASADAAMRRWAQACNERGGYLGRPVNTDKGWAERMARLWGRDSSYVRDRASLRAELRALGFGLD